MFTSEIYSDRRKRLKSILKKGIAVFPGNDNISRNYKANTYRFRQDSTFLYYFGINKPGISAVIDMENDLDIIYGDNLSMDDIVWMGNLESIESLGAKAGVKDVRPTGKLPDDISDALKKQRIVHYLPPYHDSTKENIAEWLHIDMKEVDRSASVELIKAVASMRIVKEGCEIKEIDNTLTRITREMHLRAMQMTESGRYEHEIAGEIEGIALKNYASLAYPAICTVHGEVLHNEDYTNKLKKGDLLLVDAGAESPEFYATDITRTFPVDGEFTEIQKNIYSVVLEVQEHAISLIKPRIKYQDIHMAASIRMAEKLTELDFFKGQAEDIVEKGAHALVFPHGLGHLLGLDVHDMENLGEQYTGYDEHTKRSSQFGTAYLRFGRELQEGCVLTVEPGIYFIPPLIDLWESKGMHKDMIQYSEIRKYINFGGIRIEDNIVVTHDNYRILGKQIPKNIVDISY